METISLIPTSASRRQTVARRSRKSYPFSPTVFLFLICLLGCLAYGLTQIDTLTAFYENLTAEIGRLEFLLRNLNLGLK